MKIQNALQVMTKLKKEQQHAAKHLLLAILQQPASFLIIAEEHQLTTSQRQQFNEGIEQLQQGKPLAYILGNQPFWSLDFKVNQHTLIPRPETEHLVEQALLCGDALKHTYLNVLDMGTGSGVIAVCLKHERPKWEITATDISENALLMAKTNARLNHTSINFFQGDWYHAIANNKNKTFHMIVSNPPYIAKDDHHLADLVDEPITALVANHEGMADIKVIIAGAKQHLYQGGWLLVEHGYNQSKQVRDCFMNHHFCHIKTISDYANNERMTMAQAQG